jgi:hypothetical protein
MTRLYGWAPRGRRLVAKVPHGHWKTATFLAALRNDRIEAPCVFDGPINGERFRAYVEQFLVPTLKPNDIVILDNLGSHKGKAVRNAIKAVGARLTSMTAPVASGWSVWPGGTCTHWKAPPCHGAHVKRTLRRPRSHRGLLD